MKTALVDYGRGNLLSVARAVERCGGDVDLVSDAATVAAANRLILPGVGAFGDCITQLRSLGLIETLLEFVRSERPFLGICVGMQILFGEGEEFGAHAGLGVIRGRVEAIPKTDAENKPHKTPHIGWTPLRPPDGAGAERWRGTVLDKIDVGEPVYFVHSFTGRPDNAADRLADADYNGRLISAAVQRGPLTGVQFHPEKSGAVGLKLLQSFLNI